MLPRCLAVLTLVAGSVLVGTPAFAETPAERAAREIQDARDRANAAAQAMFDKEAEIDALELAIAESEREVAELESEVGALREGLADRAVARFTAGGADTNPLFTDIGQMNSQASADVYAEIATGDQLVGVDDYDQSIDDLEQSRARLADQQRDAEQARDTFEALQARAEAEVVQLQEIEAERLRDEAVRIALEAERQRRIAEEQRQADAAAARAAAEQAAQQPPTPQAAQGVVGPPVQQPDPQPAQPDADSASPQGQAATPAPTPDPEPEPPAAPPVAVTSGIVCPLQGSYSFADTWGAARSGGRSHQGVDMISPTGTPIVAVKSGSVAFKVNSLGGNSAWVTANDGDRYYYAHMSRWEGGNRSVTQGEVIGYVGDTGNASGTPHLHFEVHPGGGVAVNPYPYVRAVC